MRTKLAAYTALLVASSSINATHPYLLGLGIGDITGPVVETNMGGYADLSQTDTGLHMRMRSRAFIVADAVDTTSRILFINSDIAFGDSGVRRGIIDAISATYPGLYSSDNVALVGTHSHAGVGGYFESLLPQLTSLGYVNESAQAIIDGSVLAVQRAHASLAPGTLGVGNTTVLDGNANRSPSAYVANPAAERAQYEHDTDKVMTVLRFNDEAGNARGLLSFYAVHGTSIYQNNTLISTDNKGMAAYLYENEVEPTAMPGNTTFVAGFVQSNVGDTTPNTLGAFCESPGKPHHGQRCDFNSSTCGGSAQDCHGRGPGFRISDFESNRIIGDRQFRGAKRIMDDSLVPVTGPVKSVYAWMNMTFRPIQLANGTTVQTCPPAMGHSFAGGTTDGPGHFDFTQGKTSGNVSNPLWAIVGAGVTSRPSREQADCQYPKPVLLNTGYSHKPYEWQPDTVPVQILRVGQFVMLIAPGEFTTMAGRRLRNAVRSKLLFEGVIDNSAYVVIAGPANAYAHYITTPEEYAIQRYEGASTIYGQYTLEAYMDKFTSIIKYLSPSVTGSPVSDAVPAEQISKALSLRRGVVTDTAGLGRKFGSVRTDVTESYERGQTAFAVFIAANPRNNLRLEETFLTVDHLVDSSWTPYRSDSHPSTRFHWVRTSTMIGTSTANISWVIENDTPAGTYRLTYYGDYKSMVGKITPFIGYSSNFTIS